MAVATISLRSCIVVLLVALRVDRAALRAAPCGLFFPEGAAQDGQQRQDQEHEEQDLRDPRGAGGDAAEAQYRGDDGDDEENNGVVQHVVSPRMKGDQRLASKKARTSFSASSLVLP